MKHKALSLAMALCLVFSLFSWCCQISATEEKDTTRNYTVKDIISGAAAVDEVSKTNKTISQIKTDYPDTYDFLKSLENNMPYISHYGG